MGFQPFFSRLSSYTTNHEFKSLFSHFGVVKEARLAVYPTTQKPKGFGFVMVRFIRYWIKEIGFLQQWIGTPVFHFTFVSKLDARTSTLV
ncbi:hypothetical protein NC652_022788 [Populus alba x Populus x berolinensis]|nr:hypothetical protein NC652_022788 [Populus alba x Populus x berolinensis]